MFFFLFFGIFLRNGVRDLAENLSYWGSGRPRGALKPSEKVGGEAPPPSWMVLKPLRATQTPPKKHKKQQEIREIWPGVFCLSVREAVL